MDPQGTLVRFGLLGASRIAPRALLEPMRTNPMATACVIAARDRARASAFARQHAVHRVADSYEELIHDPQVDAVYNGLPNSLHCEWTMKALYAGKHVLCEKCLATNQEEAEAMAAVARKSGLMLMEAFHYRYHPVFERLIHLYQNGSIGALKHIYAFFKDGLPPDNDIRMQYETGGGAMMDMGCYLISWIRQLTGEEPVVTDAKAIVGPPNIDLAMGAEFRLPSGATATMEVSKEKHSNFEARLTIKGESGVLKVDNPLIPQTGHQIELITQRGRIAETQTRRPTYAFQLDRFISAVRCGLGFPTDGEEAVLGLRVIDACYLAAGLPRRGLQRTSSLPH